jgi:hypothetical protein
MSFTMAPDNEYSGTFNAGELPWSLDFGRISVEHRLSCMSPDRLEGSVTVGGDVYPRIVTRRRFLRENQVSGTVEVP